VLGAQLLNNAWKRGNCLKAIATTIVEQNNRARAGGGQNACDNRESAWYRPVLCVVVPDDSRQAKFIDNSQYLGADSSIGWAKKDWAYTGHLLDDIRSLCDLLAHHARRQGW
jgi:hypothetical protein